MSLEIIKQEDVTRGDYPEGLIPAGDVKKAVRELKECFCCETEPGVTCENDIEEPTCPECNKIDKIFGEELI